MSALLPDEIGRLQSRGGDTESAHPGNQAEVDRGETLRAAQGRSEQLLPKRRLQAEGAPIALSSYDTAKHLGGADGRIETRPRIATGDKAVCLAMHEAVDNQPLVLAEYKN